MSNYEPPRDTARVIQVIETTLTVRGRGSVVAPFRTITQYWTFDGKLLAEVDTFDTKNSDENNTL